MQIDKTCETCGEGFKVRPYRRDSARFCSGSCRAKWVASLGLNKGPKPYLIGNRFAAGQRPNRTAFRSGHEPWNTGLKNIHLSPATEFKPGRPNLDEKPIGYVSIRLRKKDCGPRAYVKIAEPNRWRLRSALVWEAVNGPVPRGRVIHHHNRDTLDDDIDNLRCLTKAEHLLEHLPELLAARWLAVLYA